jgi:hypothetical protein
MEEKLTETNTIQNENEIIWSHFEPDTIVYESERLQDSQENNRLKVMRRLEDLQNKHPDMLDQKLLKLKTQTNQWTSTHVLSKEQYQENQLNQIVESLEKAGLDDDYIMQVIAEGIQSAVFQGPKGEILRDRTNINKLIDKYFKLKKYYKSDTVINIVNGFMNPPQLY